MWGDRRPNKRVTVDGIKFHSIAEANQYQELKLRERTGEIYELEQQIRIPIVINGIHICYYIADFRYKHLNEKLPIIHEHKGFWEEKALLKWQIVQALYQDQYKFVTTGEQKKATYASKRGFGKRVSAARR